MAYRRELTPLEKEIHGIIDRHILTSGFDPTTCMNELIKWFIKRCQRGKELDPYNPSKAEIANNLCGQVSQQFEQNGFPSASIRLLLCLWNKFSKCQLKENERVYKAGIAYWLSESYRKRGDVGASIRWALLCHADDMLRTIPHKGSGSHRLLNTLGMTRDAYDAINKIAEANFQNGNWSHRSHFPEDILVEFTLQCPQYAYWITQPTSVVEFPVSRAYFKALRHDLKAAGELEDSQQIGKAFEDLATYLTLLIPSWLPQKNVSPDEKPYEHDIVISNMMSSDNLEVDVYGRAFLAECKYLNHAVSANEVGYFLHRMHLTHTKFGIIFTKDGISGEDQDRYAQNQISRAYQQDKRICIVFDETDLNKLETGNVSFRAMLLKKVNDLRFGKPQSRNISTNDDS